MRKVGESKLLGLQGSSMGCMATGWKKFIFDRIHTHHASHGHTHTAVACAARGDGRGQDGEVAHFDRLFNFISTVLTCSGGRSRRARRSGAHHHFIRSGRKVVECALSIRRVGSHRIQKRRALIETIYRFGETRYGSD